MARLPGLGPPGGSHILEIEPAQIIHPEFPIANTWRRTLAVARKLKGGKHEIAEIYLKRS